jgi:hypothetical protein
VPQDGNNNVEDGNFEKISNCIMKIILKNGDEEKWVWLRHNKDMYELEVRMIPWSHLYPMVGRKTPMNVLELPIITMTKLVFEPGHVLALFLLHPDHLVDHNPWCKVEALRILLVVGATIPVLVVPHLVRHIMEVDLQDHHHNSLHRLFHREDPYHPLRHLLGGFNGHLDTEFIVTVLFYEWWVLIIYLGVASRRKQE